MAASPVTRNHLIAQHNNYEVLHPFIDGNGRSGRAITLWFAQSIPDEAECLLRWGFLRWYYYRNLGSFREWKLTVAEGVYRS